MEEEDLKKQLIKSREDVGLKFFNVDETQRIKEIIEREINSIINFRNQHIKHRHLRNISLLEKIKHNILFFIDHPDYKRKTIS